MSISSDLVKKATEAGTLPPSMLNLGEQILDPITGKSKGVKSTGPHTVKFLEDKEAQGTDFYTKQPRAEVHYLFEENGVKKRYAVSKYGKNNETKQYTEELHYVVVKMAEVEVGQTIVLEMIGQGGKNFIRFSHPLEAVSTVPESEIPVINEEGQEPRKMVNTENGLKPLDEINGDL